MLIYNLPLVHFPFHKIALGWSLESIAEDPDLITIFKKFVEYVKPFFNSKDLKPDDLPFIRVHEENDRAKYYPSSDVLFCSKLIIVPMTPLFYQNSFKLESSPRLGDFNYVNLKVGQFAIIDGRCDLVDHGTNTSGATSVSLMFGFETWRRQQ